MLINNVKEINNDIEKYIFKNNSEHGTGGMRTKLEALKSAKFRGVIWQFRMD